MDRHRRGPVQLCPRALNDPHRRRVALRVLGVDRDRGWRNLPGRRNDPRAPDRKIRSIYVASAAPCGQRRSPIAQAPIRYEDLPPHRIQRDAVGIGHLRPASLENAHRAPVIRDILVEDHDGHIVLDRQEQFLRLLVRRDAKRGVGAPDPPFRCHIPHSVAPKDGHPSHRVVVDRINVSGGRIHIHAGHVLKE